MTNRKWSIPNSVLLSQSEKDNLEEAFKIVIGSEEFKSIADPWNLDRADILSSSDVARYYSTGGQDRDKWYPALVNALVDSETVGVFEVKDHNRSGLEHLPKSVVGRSRTFFVDLKKRKVVHVLVSVYSI